MIDGFYTVSNTEHEAFVKDVSNNIAHLQGQGLEVEIQFCTDMLGNKIVYSAILIGRVKNVS